VRRDPLKLLVRRPDMIPVHAVRPLRRWSILAVVSTVAEPDTCAIQLDDRGRTIAMQFALPVPCLGPIKMHEEFPFQDEDLHAIPKPAGMPVTAHQ
jgi:hypothetical protein